jgi:hypothetical protein
MTTFMKLSCAGILGVPALVALNVRSPWGLGLWGAAILLLQITAYRMAR